MTKYILPFLLLLPFLIFGQPQTPYSFSFSLPAAARVSAGVYNGNYLIRTLFSNKQFPAGDHTQYWDGLDDEMTPVRSIQGLSVKVLSSNVKYEWEGVIGNTSKEKSGSTVHFGFSSFQYLIVEGNRAYYSKGYSEGHPGQAYFNLDNIQEKTMLFPNEGQKTSQSTDVICSDGVNVYWGGHDPGSSKYATSLGKGNFSFVFATRISDNSEVNFGAGASFKTGTGRTYRSVINNVNNTSGVITGMAVQRKGRLILIARSGMNTIDVVDKLSGNLVKTITNIQQPGSLAFDAGGNLWIITGRQLKKYSVDANAGLQQLAVADGLEQPLALAVSPDSKTVVVADGGRSQQLKAFGITAKPLWVFGQAGGYYKNALVADDKFYWSDARKQYGCSVSFENDGSFWVVDGGNYRAQHYDAGKKFIERVMFLPHMYEVYVDPKVPSRLFADFLEFEVDYSKPLQPGNGSWKLARNWGATIGPSSYSQYIPFKPVQFSNGRTYSLLVNSQTKKYDVVELTGTGTLRNAGTGVAAISNQYIAADGSFYSMPLLKNNAAAQFTKNPLTGFTKDGDPVWGNAQVIASVSNPSPDDPFYTGDINTLSAGQVTSNQDLVVFDAGRGTGFHIGGIKLGDNKWQWRTALATHKDYSGDYPTDGYYDIGNGVKNAGITALALGENIFWGYKGEFWKNLQTNFWQHLNQDGLMIGMFGNVRSKDVELVKPAESGNAVNGAVVKVGDDYYFYHGEEGTHSGIHRWKISNTKSVKIETAGIVVSSNTSAAKGKKNMMKDLPRNVTVQDNESGWKRFPASDDLTDNYKKFWKVTTNSKSYDKFNSPDISVRFRQEAKTDAYITKDLGSNDLDTWSIECSINYDGNNAAVELDKQGKNILGGQYMEVLDNKGRVIVRINPQLNYATKLMQLMANGQAVKEGDEKEMNTYTKSFQPLNIRVNHGSISVQYADSPAKTVPLFDATANYKTPATIRLYFWSEGRAYDKTVSLKDLVFND